MNNLNFVIVPTVQLRYKQLLIYNKFHFDVNYLKRLSYARTERLRNTKNYSGTVTVGAKKRMAKAVDTLLMISPMQKIFNPIINKFQTFQLTFITLTISDNTKNYSASECYDLLLSPFLRWLRDKKDCKSYIWKLELQARGQIHYHLTTNKFLRFDEIKNEWNRLQKKCGMLEDFNNKFSHYNANSTDIHAVYKVNDIKKYLLKYLSKSEQNDVSVNGKIWDCSQNLKGVKNFELDYDNLDARKMLNYLNAPDIDCFKNEHCQIISSKKVKTTSILNQSQLVEFNEWYKNLQPK